MEFGSLHRRALAAARKLFTAELELLDLLNAIEACRGFELLGRTSLFGYATEDLGLSEDCAYKLIRVARKSLEVPVLRLALAEGRIGLTKAVVITPVVTPENADHWIALAATLPKRELERLVADINPAPPGRERVKEQGNGFVRIEVSIPVETHALIQRAQELVAQKKGKHATMADTFHVVLDRFVRKEDPVEKAKRKTRKTGPGASSANPPKEKKSGPKNVGAATEHTVHARDLGRCQFKMPNGKICGERKWLHLHHVKPRSEGGADDPDNLLTLCSAHHRMVHGTAEPLH